MEQNIALELKNITKTFGKNFQNMFSLHIPDLSVNNVDTP